jgi:drug/metabolite transporter (DMT)-like permease
VLAAALLWSTSGVFVKTMPGLSFQTIAVYRASAAGLALFCLVLAVRAPMTWNPRMLGMAACFAAMNYTFIGAMSKTTAANAIVLQYTAPAWILLVGVAVLKQPLVKPDARATAGAMVGIAILIAGEWQAGGENKFGLLLGLTSGVTYAGVVMFLRHLRDHVALWLAAVNHLAAGILLAAGLRLAGTVLDRPTTTELFQLTLFGVGQMALPYVLFARGLRSISAQEASLLSLLEPTLNPVWTYLAKGERPSGWTYVGGAILIATLALRYWPTRGSTRPTAR